MGKKICSIIIIYIGIILLVGSFADTSKVLSIEVYLGEVINLKEYVGKKGLSFEFSQNVIVQNLNASVISIDNSFEAKTINIGQGKLILTNERDRVEVNILVNSPIETLELEHKYFSLLLGEIYDLKYEIKFKGESPELAQSLIRWTSSKKSVAHVTKTNQVVTNAPGTTTIAAVGLDGTILAEIEISVIGHSNKLRIVNKSGVRDLNVGETLALEAYLGSKDVTKSIKWTSLTPHVIKVSDDGLLTAVGDGEGKVQVESSKGQKSTYILYAHSMIDRIELNNTVLKFEGIGQTHQLLFNLYPKNSNLPPILNGYGYVSSNESVATVSESGLITAKGVGIALISVVFDDSQKRGSCTVEVLNDKTLFSNYVSPESIEMSPHVGYALIGEKVLLDYTLHPNNVSNKQVEFNIVGGDNNQIKKISNQYYFIPRKRGTIKIEAKAADGVSNAISIVVASPIESLDLSLSTRRIVGTNEEKMYIGEKSKIVTRVYPREGYSLSDVYPSSLIYELDNTGIVELCIENNEYYLKALKKGKTCLKVFNLEKMYESSLWITVDDPFTSLKTDAEVTLPIKIAYTPRIDANIKSGAKKVYGLDNLTESVKINQEAIYLSETFVEDEIRYEKDQLALISSGTNAHLVEKSLKSHQSRLALLESYKANMDDGYCLLVNVHELKNHQNKPYIFYTIENGEVKSNYPVKIVFEVSLGSTVHKAITVIRWVKNERSFYIKPLNKVYNYDQLINQYGLSQILETLPIEDQIKLLVVYMGHKNLFNEIPTYELLSAVKAIANDDMLKELLRPMDEFVTKSDLVKLSMLLHHKYVNRYEAYNEDKVLYYYDVLDLELMKAISLGYIEQENEQFFGSASRVSDQMLDDLFKRILPEKILEGTANKQELKFEDLMIRLHELLE